MGLWPAVVTRPNTSAQAAISCQAAANGRHARNWAPPEQTRLVAGDESRRSSDNELQADRARQAITHAQYISTWRARWLAGSLMEESASDQQQRELWIRLLSRVAPEQQNGVLKGHGPARGRPPANASQAVSNG